MDQRSASPGQIQIMLCGDVMLGRGVDQILPNPCNPVLHETWRNVSSAKVFVALAERRNGAIPAARGLGYVWGDAMRDFERLAPDLKLVNLETSITARGEPQPRKGIHFRMHPDNIGALVHAGIDYCSLANNHVLDWGSDGLRDTIAALDRAGIAHAGAGHDRDRAAAPAVLSVPGKGRVLVVSFATTCSGTPGSWAADDGKAGVNLIALSDDGFERIQRSIAAIRQPGDIVVASVHWGSNFGHQISDAQQDFARRLIDEAQCDLIHGHSSHHVRAIELHRGKPILYGCGDLINDYEGIPKSPQRNSHSELGLIYFVRVAKGTNRVTALSMRPTRMHRMRIQHADGVEVSQLCDILNRESAKWGTRIARDGAMLHLEIPG
jgi:poly-gamma-glutamate synthesis protein (capsule biosynthesis protein)